MAWILVLYLIGGCIALIVTSAVHTRTQHNVYDDGWVYGLPIVWPLAVLWVIPYGLVRLGRWIGSPPKPKPVKATKPARALLSNGSRVDVMLVIPSTGAYRQTYRVDARGLLVVDDTRLVQDKRTTIQVEEG